MIWTREQYLDLMTFGHFERPMFVELFGPLIGLEDEWRAQGAAEDEINLTAFCFDHVELAFFGGQCAPLLPPPVTLREDDEMRIQRDGYGRTVQLCKKTATIPLPMDFPVKNMDDWLKLKPAFTFRPERINWEGVERARCEQERGKLVLAYIPGAFDIPRELMGEEVACMAYYDQPELMHDILATLQDTAMRTLEPISRKLQIDQLSVHEDFAGKSGPLAGPEQIGQYFKPYYRAIWDMLQSRGAKIFQQDTDGNVNPVMDQLLDTGLTCIYPMEPAAGMDIVALRKQYGRRLMMSGGLDKHVLRQDRAAIRRELEYKLQPLMHDTGGIVFGLDHRIPNGTPIANYRYYVDTAREILGLPPRTQEPKGWARMAF
jgi:uroporphyrinogen-III decarboxylase